MCVCVCVCVYVEVDKHMQKFVHGKYVNTQINQELQEFIEKYACLLFLCSRKVDFDI